MSPIRILQGFCITILLLHAAPVSAWELPFRLTDFSVTDWRLSHQAKRVLQDKPELAKLNIGVSVKDRVATVWGVVPDQALLNLIDTTLKSVPNIASVINECTVQAPADTTPNEIAAEVRLRQKQKADAEASWGTPDPPKSISRPVSMQDSEDNRQAQKPSVTLGEPEIDQAESPAPIAPKNNSLETLRKEARALGLSIDFRRGEAVISGRVEKLSYAWDLAEKLAEIPEVERVVFGPIKKR
ncbi:BON domain-containing protein [Telmatocola sphagniphila]|uniref:BON domain-containing protein n=1 Tax=Telmatocola sphagniphila TaxID=1123043 RepID=A0A8E6B8L4_9BACT|nr:BON domain-containing protein [Telmatocola sphagniphila]QVL32405.1 BON domain-containing protein [Telmatocola sphagniphila]